MVEAACRLQSVTGTEYFTLEQAYKHFNSNLFFDAFGNRLPDCLITFQRSPYYGYFYSTRFQSRIDARVKTDEIALNPDAFSGRSDKEILSTLAHEMVHMHQQYFGKPSRNAYHNREWAEMMEAIGLMPSNTGRPGGTKTGQRMSHYVIPGGLFDQAVTELLALGLHLNWQSGVANRRDNQGNVHKSHPRNKTKFHCVQCGQNAWAKPTAHLICGDCQRRMTLY